MSRRAAVILVLSMQWFLLGGVMLALAFTKPHTWFLMQRPLGLALAVCGIVIVILAFREHRKINRSAIINMAPVPKPESELVTSGIYAVVRHPLYAAAIITSVGLMLLHGSAAVGLTCALTIVFYSFKSSYEETLLREHYPGYEVYMKETGRLWPRCRSRTTKKSPAPPRR